MEAKGGNKKHNKKLLVLIFSILVIESILLFSFFPKRFDIIRFYRKKRLELLRHANRKYREFNLVTISDKLNWLAIHDVSQLKGNCSDKILLHQYAKKKIGKDICNKILKIYDNVNQIKVEELPEKFVLKANHGSQYNIIVENKTNFDFSAAKKTLSKWLNTDFGNITAEFHYLLIKKKIFAEEYIGANLKNYKFLCYHGVPKYVYVSIIENHRKYRNFYDMNWNFLKFECLSEPHPTYKYPKPKYFELMKEYAKKLSSEFKFVRVDLYELEKEVRLGELTFIPMNSGFFCKNKKDEIEIGKDIII